MYRCRVNLPVKSKGELPMIPLESRLFLRNTGSPIKAFGDDEEFPIVTIKRLDKGGRK